ncbi:early light-induced protein 1, chloroplastic-like isoform X2 [Rhodamnia argentea]|uniref:Early light-induced protein 1, chloroplastic-like isoform X1 n=1 Tax=Rhodamnia argentea TaxID=178133 RepID=A0A8B8PRJ3_9MYRT|nr:early light-induced protein 1, chloroplastic-like isoform X2 [Rhodamnia argentea]XP_048136272.1 early light-induced protein 1, chloroplastic-like isoform X2 [Rhodamnia argentea]
MASANLMSSIPGSPRTAIHINSRRSVVRVLFPGNHVPRMSHRSGLRVKCMSEETKPEGSTGTPASDIPSSPSSPSTPNPSPKPKAKASTNFTDLFAFSGPAPERINGRLAMIGFVAAIAVELSKGEDLFAQISDGGIPWFIGTSILLSVASLVPLFQGVTVESKSNGLMTSDAELWNGRLAMLGLVALAFTEYVKGGTLV